MCLPSAEAIQDDDSVKHILNRSAELLLCLRGGKAVWILKHEGAEALAVDGGLHEVFLLYLDRGKITALSIYTRTPTVAVI